MADLFVFAELSETKTEFSDYDVTIAGKSGAGKTTLALELFKGKCCLFDIENGAKAIRGVYKFVPTSWKDLQKKQKEWKRAIKDGHKPPFEVLIFDSQTKLSLMCDEYVLSTNGWEDFTQGKDNVNRWNVRKKEYDTMINGFKELGFKIVYVCHGKDKTIKLRGQEEYKQFVPDVSGSFEYPVLGEVDFVFYLEKTRVKDENDKPKEVRRLILQNDLDYGVKCRFPELPDEIIYDDYKKGVKAFYKAWDEAVNGIESEEPTEEPTYEFASVQEEPTKERTQPKVEEPKVDETPVEVVTNAAAKQEITLEELQDKAVKVRDKLLEEKSTEEVKSILRSELGKVKISTVTDTNALTNFISKYE